jgi:hypothetical protein
MISDLRVADELELTFDNVSLQPYTRTTN